MAQEMTDVLDLHKEVSRGSESSRSSSESSNQGEDEHYDGWNDDEEVEVKGLLSSATFPSVTELIDHHRATYDLDLLDIVTRCQISTVTLIMLINYIRYQVQQVSNDDTTQSPEFVKDLKEAIIDRKEYNDDFYMTPIIPDDPLLFLLEEVLSDVFNLSLFEEDEEDEELARLKEESEAAKESFLHANPELKNLGSELNASS